MPTSQSKRILLIEDNIGDIELSRRAFRDTGIIFEVAKNGEEALERLFSSLPRPDLILLDLNLPRVTGWEVLEQIKRSPLTRSIPVIILTSSEADADILSSYKLHANAYVTKPATPAKFKDFAETFIGWWYDFVTLAKAGEET
jgi:CheY-like chemotaxis protein